MPLFDIFLSKEGDILPIRSSEYFSFNGTSSKDFDIYNVNITSGLMEEPFLPTAEVIARRIPGRDKGYFQRKELEPLKFDIVALIDGTLTRDNLRAIARWLNTDYYKPLWFSDEPERIFYAIYTGESILKHNGKQGYITLQFTCDSPYSYSPDIVSEEYYLTSHYLSYTDNFSEGKLEDVEVIPE